LKAKHQRKQECLESLHKTFKKILSLETIPLKGRVNGFLKRNIQEFIVQYTVEYSQNQLSLIPF
jgi:hypothetical protein